MLILRHNTILLKFHFQNLHPKRCKICYFLSWLEQQNLISSTAFTFTTRTSQNLTFKYKFKKGAEILWGWAGDKDVVEAKVDGCRCCQTQSSWLASPSTSCDCHCALNALLCDEVNHLQQCLGLWWEEPASEGYLYKDQIKTTCNLHKTDSSKKKIVGWISTLRLI